MKIGIFGGTFDPFTKAHEAIVKAVLDQKLVDEVWIVPTIIGYYRKDKVKWLNFDDRIAVIKNAVKKLQADIKYKERIFIDDTEIEFAENNAPYIVNKRRYIDTLNQFIYGETKYDDDTFPPIEFYTIIGSDSYKNFKTWTDWEEILKLSKLIVVNGRGGEDVQLDIPKIDLRIDPKYANMSSTNIRKRYIFKTYEEYIADEFNNSVIESVRYETPIFNLVKKTVPNMNFHPYGINSKDWALIIVEHEGKFLMEKQLRYGLMKQQIEFPSGIIEDNETASVGIIRELEEETGIKILNESQILHLGKIATNPAFMDNYMNYFYVNLNNAEFVQLNQKLDEHEKLELCWLPKDKVFEIIGTEESLSVFSVAALKLYMEKCNGQNT